MKALRSYWSTWHATIQEATDRVRLLVICLLSIILKSLLSFFYQKLSSYRIDHFLKLCQIRGYSYDTAPLHYRLWSVMTLERLQNMLTIKVRIRLIYTSSFGCTVFLGILYFPNFLSSNKPVFFLIFKVPLWLVFCCYATMI